MYSKQGMKHNLRASWIGAMALAAGCGEMATYTTTTEGNVALGIAEFQIYQSAELTKVIGVDSEHREIGRLELIHGMFMPTQDFGDAYNGHPIDGRKLSVTVLGSELAWETLGYSDTTHMPALPPSPVTTFVWDPQVRPLLQKWSIDWDETLDESGPPHETVTGCDSVKVGSNPRDCSGFGTSGVSCTIRSGATGTSTTQACVGNAEWEGKTLDFFSGPGQPYDGTYVFLCCGSQTSGSYGSKSCAALQGQGANCAHPTDYCSPCGDSGTNKCQQCPSVTFNYSGHCELTTTSIGGGLSEVCYDIDNCRLNGVSCSSDTDCCSDHCNGNSCVACIESGGFCNSSADCCGGGACCNFTCTTFVICE